MRLFFLETGECQRIFTVHTNVLFVSTEIFKINVFLYFQETFYHRRTSRNTSIVFYPHPLYHQRLHRLIRRLTLWASGIFPVLSPICGSFLTNYPTPSTRVFGKKWNDDKNWWRTNPQAYPPKPFLLHWCHELSFHELVLSGLFVWQLH